MKCNITLCKTPCADLCKTHWPKISIFNKIVLIIKKCNKNYIFINNAVNVLFQNSLLVEHLSAEKSSFESYFQK